MHHMLELHKLLLPSNIRVSDKIVRLFKQKAFPYIAKTKSKKKNKQENSKNDKVQQEEILMIPSFTQFNNCIIINMLSLLFKVQKGDSEIKYL